MTDASIPNAVPAAAPAVKKPAFTFTDPGCRTEVRLGALIVLGAVFLWLWAGPTTASKLYMGGAALLLIGIPLQALQGRTGRPGYPWKLGLAMTALGLAMWPDLQFREVAGGPVKVQDIAWMLAAAGTWILLWWPLSRRRLNGDPA
jgi:hypothetical protein